MTVRHHKKAGAWRRNQDFSFRFQRADADNVIWACLEGEFGVSRVDPLYLAGEMSQEARDGAAHVTGSMQLQEESRAGQRRKGACL